MEGSPDNITTRSLLKGILATEPDRTVVKNRRKKRTSAQRSTSYVHQYDNSSSPSMNLRGKMKGRLTRSLGKSALTASAIKRKVETHSRTTKGSSPIMKALDDMTPRNLLRKIIQHEDEESMIVSQRTKAAADDQNQENPSTGQTSSLSSVNLSLPELQETEHIRVFGNIKDKRKRRVSEFEREVDKEGEASMKVAAGNKQKDSPTVTFASLSGVNLSLSDLQEKEHVRVFRKAKDQRKRRVSQFEREVDKGLSVNKEGETSMIGSRRMTGAAGNKQKDTPTAKLTSLSSVNLSLPDLQETEHVRVFRKATDKRKHRVSEFGREVDKGLSANKENYKTSNVRSDSPDSLVKSDSQLGSSDLEIPSTPESPVRKFLQRRPKRTHMMSVGDFERELEAQQLSEGSQECFIESVEGDTSDSLSTEIFVPLKKRSKYNFFANPSKIGGTPRGASKLLAFDEIKGANDELLETETRKRNTSVRTTSNAQSPEEDANEDIGENHGEPSDDSDEDIGDNHGEPSDDSDEDIGDNHGEPSDDSDEDIGDNHGEPGDDSDEDDASVDESESEVGDDIIEVEAGDVFMDVDNNTQQSKSSPSNSPKQSTDSEYSPNLPQTRHSSKSGMSSANYIHLHSANASRPEESSEASESSDDENLDLAINREIVKKKENHQMLLSASPGTPAYVKKAPSARPIKPAVSKKIQRTNSTRPKKEKSIFTRSQLKQIFSHRAQMRVSKEAMEDVEKCLDLYLNRLTEDLSAYTAHAKRKTIMRADLELLMKRQGFMTDATSLNVLIENYLPMECRRLLIPCASGGNKVFPKL
ncbi:centromere protein T isoform X2 [Eleutherodactylus coqui]|uniref:centromere protein T isoform X2 n=1 Tax=Eleutherodactylus coqui TaxID=57060 RepID=UPI003462FC16